MPPRSLAASLCWLLVIGSAACGSGDDAGSDRAAGSLRWSRCGDGAECAELEVPLDPADATVGTVVLALARHRATGERIGTLLTNPGGPGAPGLVYGEQAASIFPDELVERFDIVAWDPRGTGRSGPVDCLDDDELDAWWAVDRSPDTPAEVDDAVRAARTFASGCAASTDADLLANLSTRRTVDDLEAIRIALGEARISYLGFSYGTLLGARYADAHPGRVRTMVLDGAVDPALDATEAVRAQAIGFERALQRFLDDCARDDGCAFHSGGDPATAFDRLIDAIDAETLYAVGADGVERGLGPGEADLGVAQALYAGREGWPLLASALVEAARGDGSSLLRLADQYSGRGEDGRYTDDLEASYAIGCLDGEAPSDIAAVERLATEVAAVAPRLGEATVWYGLPCSVWPAPPDPLVGETRAAGAAPILVVATEHDPATPSFQAESLARQLDDAVLVTLDDDGHTAYLRGNACIDDIVHRYLVDLAVPRGGSRC